MKTRRTAFGWLKPRVAPVLLLALVSFSGPTRALESLTFSVPGDTDGLEDSLRGASLLLAARRTKGSDVQDFFAAAQAEYGRLLGVLYGSGHYTGVISVRIDGREAAEIDPLDIPTQIDSISVTVQPGPGFDFRVAEIAPLAKGTQLPPGFAAGQRAGTGIMQTAAAAAVDGWRDQGHAKADVAEQSIVADHARQSVDARFRIAPGPQLRFGRLIVEGNERVRTERVHAIAGMPEGATFSPADLDKAAKRLRRSGAFRSVSLSEAEEANADGSLDIAATLVEEKRRRLGYGAELSSDAGLTLSGYVMHRNLLGGAERLRIEAEVANIAGAFGGPSYSVTANFSRPATFTPDTTLEFEAGLARLDFDSFTADLVSVSAGLNHEFSDSLSGAAGLRYDYMSLTDSFDSYIYQTIALPTALTWDRRDDAQDATRGFYLSAGLTPFLGLNNAESGAQMTLDARGYRSFGGSLVAAARVQGGTILGASLLGTPRDYLFYSGGGGTVRGQPYRSLSVVDPLSGVEIGGRSYAAVSAELRGSVTDTIGWAAFYDFGVVSAEAGSVSGGQSHSGAGVGLRYKTGLGPIRLDIAAPVSGSTGAGVQFYIGLGQAF